MVFAKRPRPDANDRHVTKKFAQFTIPTKEEGFDEVKFVWADQAGATAHLQKYVLDRKKNSRVEDLKPSAWFTEKHTAFTKQLKEFRTKANAWRSKSGGKLPPAPEEDEQKEVF